MVNNNNLINLVNNKKPVELVQELKDEYKVPSFEEFMKTYENDGNLNYDDLSGGSVGEIKGYGPMPINYSWQETRNGTTYTGCGQVAQIVSVPGGCTCDASSRFCLFIKCHNWCGDGERKYACSTSRALQYAHDLEDNNWHAANVISNEVLRKCATLVREAVRHYDRGNRVNGYVRVKGNFWGSYEWSYSY